MRSDFSRIDRSLAAMLGLTSAGSIGSGDGVA